MSQCLKLTVKWFKSMCVWRERERALDREKDLTVGDPGVGKGFMHFPYNYF